MTVYTLTNAQKNKNAAAAGWAGEKKVAYGSVIFGADVGTATLTDGPKASDQYHFCKLPKGALIVGGRIYGNRVASGTSAGSTVLQWCVGLEGPIKDASGTAYLTYASCNSALGTVSVDYQRVSGVHMTDNTMDFNLGGLLYSKGPILVTEDQNAVVLCAVSGTSFISASSLSLEVDYYMQTHV